MRVDCSKGTYIRTLCHDIGGKLGCGGWLKLFRTRWTFEIEDSLRLGKWKTGGRRPAMENHSRSIRCFHPCRSLSQKERNWTGCFYNGNFFPLSFVPDGTAAGWKKTDRRRQSVSYDSSRRFVGIICMPKMRANGNQRKFFWED